MADTDTDTGTFEFPENIIRLTFEGTELAGLVIETTSVTVEGLLAIQDKSAQVESMRASATTDTEKNRAMMVEFSALIELFANVIIKWNVTKNGKPVEPNAANLMRRDPNHLMAIIRIWTTAAAGVDADLEKDLATGSISQEVLIPTEVL